MRDILTIPFEQDLFLIRARIGYHAQAGDVLWFIDRPDCTIRLHEEAELVAAVGREIEFGLALFRHRDIGNHRIDLPGGERKRPVGPRQNHHVQLAPEAIRHELREIGIEADDCFRVRRIGADGRMRRHDANGQRIFDHELKTRRHGLDRRRVLLCADASVLLGAQIETRCGERAIAHIQRHARHGGQYERRQLQTQSHSPSDVVLN